MALLNFRDVADGPGTAPLAPGRLFRSAQPFHIGATEVDLVTGSGIRTIIDLRDSREIVPPDWAPAEAAGVRVVRVPLAEQVMAVVQAPVGGSTREDGYALLGGFYTAIVEHAGVGLGLVAETVAAGEPVLVHCAAGKDRTGTVVALLLDLIGVAEQAIVDDFLLTNRAMPQVLAQLESGVPEAEAVDPDTLPAGLGEAPEPAIRTLLDHLRSRGGAAEVLQRASSADIIARAARALTG